MTSSTTSNSPPQKLNIQDQLVTQYLPSSIGDKHTKTEEEENTRKVEEGKGSVKDGNLLLPEASLKRIRSVLLGHEDLIPFPSLKPFLKTFLEGLASSSKKVLGKRNMVYEDEENKNELVQKSFKALPLPLSQLILYSAHVHAPGEIEEEYEDDDDGGNQENENNGDDGNQDQDENGDDDDENEEDQDDEEHEENENEVDDNEGEEDQDDEEDEEDENEEDQDDEEDEEYKNEVDDDEDDEEVDEEVWYNFLMNVYERMANDWERYHHFLRYFHILGRGLITLRQLRSLVEDDIGNYEDLIEEFKSVLVHYYGEDSENIEDYDANDEEDEIDENVDDVN